MVLARKFILKKVFDGLPKLEDFELVEEVLPELKEDEFQVEALFWSVDPYLRMRVGRGHVPAGTVMIGRQISRVVASKNEKFNVGDIVFSNAGWRTAGNLREDQLTELEKLCNYGALPYSLGLGVLGRPGHSAYFGFLEICQPKNGETVVVSGAAGAVGSHVGQIAKIKGCKVIGFAGSDEKVRWLRDELNFDYAYNYKTTKTLDALSESAPQGVDCYFDNVGGALSSAVLSRMNLFGRISVCGSISCYNDDPEDQPLAPLVQRHMVDKQLRMEGFLNERWKNRFHEAIEQNVAWINQGQLKYKETVNEGFNNLPKTFIGLFSGENTGKAIVSNVLS